MDSTVIGEDMEMQVVVVTHNVLPIRSLRWQNIPSSLPVKCKVYSCGRVRHKGGQQNSSKCLDKGLFYPYIRYSCTLSLLFECFFGPFRHPPLFVPVQIKIFDQSYDGEGNLKQFTSISTFHHSRCFRIATIGPIQLNPHVENFSYQDSSVSPTIGLIYRWGASISRKRGDAISLRSVAIQPPIDYVIRLEGGGA